MSLIDDVRHEILFVNEQKLRHLGACSDDYEKFIEQFPDGVEISVEVCEAHADDYDWLWAGEHFLHGQDKNDFQANYNNALRASDTNLDHLHALRGHLLSDEEYYRLLELNTKNVKKRLADLFAVAMLSRATDVVRTLTRQLKKLNNDELRYKVLFVTPERLKEAGACYATMDMFRKQFHEDGTEITKELCWLHRNDYTWTTGANLLLNEEFQTKYKEMEKSAWEMHNEIVGDTNIKFEAKEISKWQYHGILDMANDTLHGDLAVAFATCAIGQYEALKAALAAEKKSTSDESESVNPDVAAVEENTGESVVSENTDFEDDGESPGDTDW